MRWIGTARTIWSLRRRKQKLLDLRLLLPSDVRGAGWPWRSSASPRAGDLALGVVLTPAADLHLPLPFALVWRNDNGAASRARVVADVAVAGSASLFKTLNIPLNPSSHAR